MAPQSRIVCKVPAPPPAPKRSLAKARKLSPPPLPEHVPLSDADLIDDEDVTRVARATLPTSVDVELDCFSRTEPPPPSRPRRRRALLVCVTSLVVGAVTGLFLLARPVAQHALGSSNSEAKSAAPAEALSTVAVISSSVVPASVTSSAVARPKLSTHKSHGKAVAVSAKKPTKRVPHQQHALHASDAT